MPRSHLHWGLRLTPSAAVSETRHTADAINPVWSSTLIRNRPASWRLSVKVVDSLRSVVAGMNEEAFVISYSDHVQLVSDGSPASGLTDAVARIDLDAQVAKRPRRGAQR